MAVHLSVFCVVSSSRTEQLPSKQLWLHSLLFLVVMVDFSSRIMSVLSDGVLVAGVWLLLSVAEKSIRRLAGYQLPVEIFKYLTIPQLMIVWLPENLLKITSHGESPQRRGIWQSV